MDGDLKYVLYVRKSSEAEDRQAASIASQLDELNAYAERNGITFVKVFTEAQSAKAPGRPAFNEMLGMIEKGEANCIVCWKLDRLARNAIDGGKITWMLQSNIIKEIRSIERVYLPEDNVIMMQLEFGIANQYIRDLSTNTKRGLRKRLSDGWFPGVAPLGYLNNKYQQKGLEPIYPDPNSFAVVKKCWKYLLETKLPIDQLHKKAVDEWGLTNRNKMPPARSMFYKMFDNHFYYGYFYYNGELHTGKHKPMITKQQFDQAQAIIGNTKRPTYKNQKFAYTGLATCGECGCGITAETKYKNIQDGTIRSYTYYHCTKRRGKCSQKCLEENKFNEQVSEVLKEIEIPPSFHKWAIKVLKRQNAAEAQLHRETVDKYASLHKQQSIKIERLLNLQLAGGIDIEEYKTQNNKLKEEKARLKSMMDSHTEETTDWLERADQVFNFAVLASKSFQNASLEARREILTNLGQMIVLKDRKLTITLPDELKKVLTAAKEVKKIHGMLEPKNAQVKQGHLEDLYTTNPVLLRR